MIIKIPVKDKVPLKYWMGVSCYLTRDLQMSVSSALESSIIEFERL